MSFDLSQLPQLLQLQHGQNPQILSVSGTANQMLHPNQGAISSGGPNASQSFQVANSNIQQITYNLNFIGNPDLGARAIANGAHPDHQDSQSTAISYARKSTIEASKFIGSNSVQNAQPGDLSVNQAELNAKLAAVKESTVEVGKCTAKLKGSTVKVVETTAKLSEWITALNWPTLKLGLVSEADITLGDLTVEYRMSILKLGLSFLEFAQSSVEYGGSTIRDSDSMTVGESISPVAFDGLTSKLGEVAARFKESRTKFMESFMESVAHFERTGFIKNASALDNSQGSRLRELMETADFDTLEGICVELKESNETVSRLLVAFSESMVAYAKSLGAPDDVIAAFSRQDQ